MVERNNQVIQTDGNECLSAEINMAYAIIVRCFEKEGLTNKTLPRVVENKKGD
jgi:3-oxoacyl-[acyl-carrier-protein] synthase III